MLIRILLCRQKKKKEKKTKTITSDYTFKGCIKFQYIYFKKKNKLIICILIP